MAKAWHNITINNQAFKWRVGSSHVAIRNVPENFRVPKWSANPSLVELSDTYWKWGESEPTCVKTADPAIRRVLISLFIRSECFGQDVSDDFKQLVSQFARTDADHEHA